MNIRPLIEDGVITLFGDISEKSVKDVVEQVLVLNRSDIDSITIIIDSAGGTVHEALCLIDVMLLTRKKIITIGLGQICSAALLIFLAGDERKITQNTSILSHQYSGWGAEGKYHELVAGRKEEDRLEERVEQFVKMRLNATIAKKILGTTDNWITPREAIKLKIAHSIIKTL